MLCSTSDVCFQIFKEKSGLEQYVRLTVFLGRKNSAERWTKRRRRRSSATQRWKTRAEKSRSIPSFRWRKREQTRWYGFCNSKCRVDLLSSNLWSMSSLLLHANKLCLSHWSSLHMVQN